VWSMQRVKFVLSLGIVAVVVVVIAVETETGSVVVVAVHRRAVEPSTPTTAASHATSAVITRTIVHVLGAVAAVLALTDVAGHLQGQGHVNVAAATVAVPAGLHLVVATALHAAVHHEAVDQTRHNTGSSRPTERERERERERGAVQQSKLTLLIVELFIIFHG
jgi:hypothetical protein